MIKRTAHIVLSAWLSILLLFGSTSKEFVHLFADHEDTVHCNAIHHGDGLVIEPEHHHCTFLSFSLAPFINPVWGVEIRPGVITYPAHIADEVTHLIPRSVITPSLRGPPASALV